jgi:Tol biopolymer transport system component
MNARKTVWARAALVIAALGSFALPLAAQGPPGKNGPKKKPLPLAAARHAEFTATEGTWISLDMSPDGKTIVFDFLGDLYTMPATGGKATALLTGMAFETQPRFSPDGKRIAFVSDRSGGDNLWTMALDLTDTTQISRGNNSQYVSPEWTPDGEYIVVSRSGGLGGAAKLMMYNAERHSPIPVISAPRQLKTLGAAVSPDGRYIWYAGRSGDWQYNARLPQYQLYRYDREMGTSTLMTNRWGSGFRPAVSPDGNWLVYGSRYNTDTGLLKRDLRTGDESWLAYPVQRDEQESRAPLDVLPGYSFTPDGSAVVTSYGGKIWRVPMDGSEATEIPFEIEANVAVGPEVKFAYQIDTTAMVTASQIRSPALSPDGGRIVFTAFDRLWVKDMPDGEARRLTHAEVGEFHPKWSPDGAWVAYVTWDDSDGGQIMKVPADGSAAPTQLTNTAAMYYNLAWSPDGKRIVASRGAARQLRDAAGVFFGPIGGEFVWLPSSGGDVTTISPTGTRDVAHFRSDDPDRIYAYSPVEGLVSFRWDGTDVKRHLDVRGAPAPGGIANPHPDEWEFLPSRVFPWRKAPDPTQVDLDPSAEPRGPPPAGLVVLSPRGDRAFAQVGRDIYIVDLAEVGSTPPRVMVANLAGAPVPVRKLTDVGGEFASWSQDGTKVLWAMGNTLFTYDLSEVEAEEDTVEATVHARALLRVRAAAVSDSLKTKRAAADSLKKADEEVPDSLTAEIVRLAADSVQVEADSLLARADSIRRAAEKIAAKAEEVRAGDEDVLADSTDTYEAVEEKIEVEMPRDIPRGTVVLRGGRIVTMKGDEVIEGGVVVVTDNKIVAVGLPDSVEIPEGAREIDVSGKTLLPGFVDTHYHSMWLIPEIHPEEVWQYLTTLSYGVTTTRDPQTAFTDVLSYTDRVETGGMLGPRVYSTGPGVFIGENIRSAEHAKTVLRRYAEYWNTKTLKMYMTGNRQQRQWIIKAAKELKLMPTTEGGLDFKLELTHTIDGYPGVEHALPIAPIFSDVVELFKTSGTTNTPTLLVSYGGPFGENYYYAHENVHDNAKLRTFAPEDNIDARARRRGTGSGGSPGPVGWFLDEEYVFPKHAEFVKKMLEDGGRIGVGSHGQLQGLGYHWEVWSLASGGASNHDVLRAATILGAEAIGFGDQIGSIEAGKFADILVLDSNPLDDIRNTVDLHFVMKNGRLYDARTLDESWPRQRPLERQHPNESQPHTAAGVGR